MAKRVAKVMVVMKRYFAFFRESSDRWPYSPESHSFALSEMALMVAGAHHVILLHFLNVAMVAYPILTRKKVQIPQLRLIDNRHCSPAIL